MTVRQQTFAGPKPSRVLVAGVPWPRYKLVAVIAGFVTLLVAAVFTTNAAPSVLAAAAVAVVVGLVAKTLSRN